MISLSPQFKHLVLCSPSCCKEIAKFSFIVSIPLIAARTASPSPAAASSYTAAHGPAIAMHIDIALPHFVRKRCRLAIIRTKLIDCRPIAIWLLLLHLHLLLLQ
jgi:hypothetical protein